MALATQYWALNCASTRGLAPMRQGWPTSLKEYGGSTTRTAFTCSGRRSSSATSCSTSSVMPCVAPQLGYFLNIIFSSRQSRPRPSASAPQVELAAAVQIAVAVDAAEEVDPAR